MKLAKLESKEPRLKLKVRAGSERLRKVRMKLPRQLKFAGGKTFKRGAIAKADGRKLKRRAIDRGKRTLRLKGERVTRFIAKVADGALEAGHAKGKRRLRFKVKVTDVRRSKTRLVVRARQ